MKKFECSMAKKKESLLKTNEDNSKWNDAEFKGMNRCNFKTLFGTDNRTGTTDGKIELIAQCDKVTIEKVADGVVTVDIDPYNAPAKKYLAGRTFRTNYAPFGNTDDEAIQNIITYIGEVCQARDIESSHLFQLAQR